MDIHWLEERKKGIGGSDAPAVCGVSPWKSAYQVYLEKRGEAPSQEDNDSMFWGRTLEPVIRQRYADVTGRTVTIPKGVIRHPSIEWMLASLDGITDDERVLEVKTARSAQEWGEPGTAEIPEVYLVQVQHYLSVTKLSLADVAVLIGGSDFRIYEVPADPELQRLIIEKEAAFWDMVQNAIPPEVVSYADIKQRFGKMSKAIKVQATPEVLAAIEGLKALKEVTKKEDELKALVMAYMEEADTLTDGEGILATWKAGKPAKRFDAKAFQEKHPELYAEFLKEGEASRRFLIK